MDLPTNFKVQTAVTASLVIAATLGLAISPKAEKATPISVTVEHGPNLPHRATVRLRVTVEPNAANRGLWVAIEAAGYAAAHYEQLEGSNAPKVRWWEFKDVPDGSYTAWIRLIKEHGETSASALFVVGGGEDSCQ